MSESQKHAINNITQLVNVQDLYFAMMLLELIENNEFLIASPFEYIKSAHSFIHRSVNGVHFYDKADELFDKVMANHD